MVCLFCRSHREDNFLAVKHGNYTVDLDEIMGEALDWTMQYLQYMWVDGIIFCIMLEYRSTNVMQSKLSSPYSDFCVMWPQYLVFLSTMLLKLPLLHCPLLLQLQFCDKFLVDLSRDFRNPSHEAISHVQTAWRLRRRSKTGLSFGCHVLANHIGDSILTPI